MIGRIWEKSRKVLLLTLALMMALGMMRAVPVRAAEEKLAWNPILEYEAAGKLKLTNWKIDGEETAQVYFKVSAIYNGENRVTNIQGRTGMDIDPYGEDAQDPYSFSLQKYIYHSGTYTVTVWVENGNETRITEDATCEFPYTQPPKLDPITDVAWKNNAMGMITFTGLTDTTNVEGYEVALRRVKDDYTVWVDMIASNRSECDVSTHMVEAGVDYKVAVRVISSNLGANANSDETVSPERNLGQVASSNVESSIVAGLENNSNISGITNTSKTTDIINALENNVTSGKKGDVANALIGILKQNDNKKNLKVAMRAKKDMVALVDTIEKMKNATVTPTNNATGIASVTSVVGAGLNVTSGNATLTVQSSTQDNLQLDEELKKNAVEIILKDGSTEQTGALDIPVSVTITVPTGISRSGLVILHMGSNGAVEETLYPIDNGDGTVTFTVTHFSTFVFVGGEQSSSSGGDSENKKKDDEKRYGDVVAAQITSAAKGATVKTKDITALPNSVMKMLLKRNDVTLVMEYTYNGRDYTVTIPAGAAIDNDIPWYGPLYLAGYYGNGANMVAAAPAASVPASGSSYVVKRGDTMSRIAKANGMTLAQLIQKNPQIKNVRYIKVGQKINL